MADPKGYNASVPASIRVVIGGVSGMGATFITHPLDVGIKP